MPAFWESGEHDMQLSHGVQTPMTVPLAGTQSPRARVPSGIMTPVITKVEQEARFSFPSMLEPPFCDFPPKSAPARCALPR